jgi:hypothetical protein
MKLPDSIIDDVGRPDRDDSRFIQVLSPIVLD